MHVPRPREEEIAAVRQFTRFYTRQIGLLEEGLHKTEFSLTEARILFELAHREGLTATELGGDLALDAGYLSRILKKFEDRGLLTRRPSAHDARQAHLSLTEKGRLAFAPLNDASRNQVADMLAPLAVSEREKLIGAMKTVQRLVGKTPEPKVPYVLRPLRIGDVGWIIQRQAVLYHQEYGWDGTYEALAAQILSEFVHKFDPRYETVWIAEREGEIVGSVFVVRQSDEVAKLRLLYVDPAARGLGIGRRLVAECIAFARSKGYKTLTLWTNDVLVSARRIYQAANFELVEEERHRSFGKDLVGQTWTLQL